MPGASASTSRAIRPRINAFGYDMLGPRQSGHPPGSNCGNASPTRACRCSASTVRVRSIFLGNLVSNAVSSSASTCAWRRISGHHGCAINNTTFSGTGQPMPHEEAFQRTVNGLRELADLACELNVGICLENNENTVTFDAASLYVSSVISAAPAASALPTIRSTPTFKGWMSIRVSTYLLVKSMSCM